MTVHLVTFSDESMRESAWRCESSALRNGASLATRWPFDCFKAFPVYEENKALFNQPRGCGYWAWKPWIIANVMESSSSNDVIVYADAGIEFIDNVNYIIDRMDQDIFLFGNMYEHAHWCKRDIVEEIWRRTNPYDCWLPDIWARFGKQVQASVIFFRVNDKTRAFVKEWLDWCLFEGGRLIDDSPSRTPNHPEFQENRHDQAILTTMAYRDGIKLHWWPAQYNDGAFIYERGDYPDEQIPILFHHHRRRNWEWMDHAVAV